MGLLDIFNTGDPQKDAAISRGLLQAGLQLMQSKGKFLPALSQGGMAGLGGYEHEVNRQLAAKRIGLQDQYLSNQVDQQKREAALANLPGQFYNSGQGVDATGGMDTATSNPNNIGQASFDMPGYVKALYGKNPVAALQLQQSLQKPEVKLDTLAPGAKAGYFKNGVWTEVATNPKTDDDKESPVARLIKERDKFPIGDPTRRIFDDAIKKASTHQEPVSINNYGSPLPIDLGNGKTGYIQPPARPGGPSQVLNVPGTGQPAIKPADPSVGKLGEAQKKQVAGIDALGAAVDEYVKELSTFPLTGVINPADRARIGTKYNNMMLQAKEAYNLGVLNGPDYQILQSVVADPVSLRGFTTSNRSLANQAKELKRMMEQVKKGITKEEADNDPLGIRGPKK
jgi:hypothetical protein